ncbi:MAG: 30S ribosomal protein S4e [Candidatus Heimdallarchaeota archaeon]|nr:30S ribosomal protein S4e [Candidatus Heimdallarchaeota archaeon]
MTKAGKKQHQKRLSAPTTWPVHRKGTKFVPKISPGAHGKKFGMPMLVLIRDVLGLAETRKEAKYILQSNRVLVDGKVRKKEGMPVGHMDIVTFDGTDMRYRVQLHTSRKLLAKEITEDEANYKVCKVIGKRNLRGGKTQISLHDGRNILLDNEDDRLNQISVQSSLKITVPEQEIESIYELEEESRVQVLEGRHQGKIGTILEISKRFGPKASEVIIRDENEEEFRTALDYVFVIGNELELAN